MLKKKNKGIPVPKQSEKTFPGHSNPPQPPEQTEPKTYAIPFTMEEIDAVMSTMIDLNVPVRTWLLLDSKFGPIKQQSRTPKQEVQGDTLVLQSKMNDEKGSNGPGETNNGD